jgi:REP element-mobilizing transposase RayT
MKRYWSKEFGPAYFVTNTIVEWKNMFIFRPYVKIIIDSWKHFVSERAIIFYAFTIMPSHLHYVAHPTNPQYGIIEMQRDFKKFTSKRILAGLNYELDNGFFPTIDLFEQRKLQRESAVELLGLFKLIGKYSRQSHKVWMSEEKPIQINSEKFMRQKIDYIHFNPVKSNITSEPQAYPFSSARNYYLDDESIFKITKITL